MKNQKGITLIALIITIIVMLILVGVSVSTALNTGLFTTAQGAADKTEKERQNEVNLSSGKVTIIGEDVNSTEVDIDSFAQVGNKEPISKTEDYKKYYADVNDDGTVDGVIYADLAFAGSGTWSYGYSYNAVANEDLKDYYVSQEAYEGDFGTKPVLASTGTGGTKDRFYVMALEKFKEEGNLYCWYYNADDTGMSDYETATSDAFGAGKANTATMITKWKDKEYGEQNGHSTYKDIWGPIQTKVSQGWFVPSAGEWDAFADTFSVSAEWDDDGVYCTVPYGLSHFCWSSSQYNSTNARYINFENNRVSWHGVDTDFYVRLSTTF